MAPNPAGRPVQHLPVSPAMETLWYVLTFGVPLLAMLVLSMRLNAISRRRQEVCHTCGYSLRGLRTSHCPECGASVMATPRAGHHRAMRTAAGILLGLAPFATYQFVGSCYPGVLEALVNTLVMLPTIIFFGIFYCVVPTAVFAHGWVVIHVISVLRVRTAWWS